MVPDVDVFFLAAKKSVVHRIFLASRNGGSSCGFQPGKRHNFGSFQASSLLTHLENWQS